MSDEQGTQIWDTLMDISSRLARVEALLLKMTDDARDIRETMRDHDKRISALESHRDSTIGAKDIVMWLAMAGIALWEVLK